MLVAVRSETREVQIGIRMSKILKEELEKAALRSGWTISDQIRFELMERRGLYKPPFLPNSEAPGRKDRQG